MLQATRRTTLLTAAWAAPVVTLASAAPAYAGSGPSVFGFTPGGSAAVADGDFYTVEIQGASVAVPRDALSVPATLTLTVTFAPTAGDDEIYSELTAPPGWVHEARTAGVRNVLVFTYATPITSDGAMVLFGDGSWFGTDDVVQKGTFALRFHVGSLSTTWMVTTP